MARKFSLESLLTLTDKWTKPLADAGRKYSGFAKGLQTKFNGINRSVESFNSKVRGMGKRSVFPLTAIFTGLGFGIKKAIDEASKLEDSLTGFTTLLGGNEDAARKMVDQMVILGAQTPFEFEDLSNATTMLLGFGAATKDNIIPTLKMLGDISMGNAEHLKGISLAFGQIKAAGKASMQDINQLVNNQVPILSELAKMWGVTVGQARQMVSQGRATSDEVEKAFKRMTEAGGLFHNSMIKKSETFSGVTSTLADSVKSLLALIGVRLLPYAKEYALKINKIVARVSEWVINNKELIKTRIDGFLRAASSALSVIWKILKFVINLFIDYHNIIIPVATAVLTLIGVLQVYEFTVKSILVIQKIWSASQKAFLLLQKLSIVKQWAFIAVQKAWLAIQKAVTIAQWAFNVAMSANPIGLTIIAVAGLIAVLTVLAMKWDSISAWLDQVTEKLNKFGVVGKMISFILRLSFKPLELLIRGIRGLGSAFDYIKGKLGLGGKTTISQTTNTNQTTVPSQPIRPSARGMTTNNTTVNRSEVGINVNAPKGTTVKQRGNPAPGTTLNLGVQ